MKSGDALRAAIEAASFLPVSVIAYRVSNLTYLETLTSSAGSFRADNRFTRAGLSNALYVADAPDLALREATQAYQDEFRAPEIPAHAVYPVHVRATRVLDLTDIETRVQLDVSMMALTGDWRAALKMHREDARNRIETHEISEACFSLGIEGVRYPSAFDGFRHNYVLFGENMVIGAKSKLPDVVLRAQALLRREKDTR
ncbi:RES family NAD+ phosphorylase (plasmid) [Deinococcus radiomollis]|uniref:RES family NAD+ phosphorylase n=1 Tax=Deinococcus radiomollis TaxID=468916 RepID=UPI0038912341